MKARAAEAWARFLHALQFLTRLPVRVAYDPRRMAASSAWHPAVGLLIGAFAGLVFWLASRVFPPALAALLSTAAGMLLTGALHEDGFADVCDGLGGGRTRERVLEIMRDSRLGTYGAAGLGLMLGAKILAVAALPVAVVPGVLVAGHAASRASAVLLLATSVYARFDGAAGSVAGGPSSGGLGLAVAVGGLALLSLLLFLPVGSVACGVLGLALGHAAMRAAFERRLAGYTGDCVGATQQTSELGLYLGALACL